MRLKNDEGREVAFEFNNRVPLVSLKDDESLTVQMLSEEINKDHSTIVF